MSRPDEPLHYSLIIDWSPEDAAFIVTVPELPGCRTHGETYEEAVAQAKDAIEGWLDVADQDGMAPPPPRLYDDARDRWPELSRELTATATRR
jgi:predicted RNase H-like HicB family nuclease